MHVLMIGAGEPPPTFIQRQAEGLKQIGISIKCLPVVRRPRWQTYLIQAGIDLAIPDYQAAAVKWADILHFQWPTDWLNQYALVKKYRKPSLLSLRGRQINIRPHLPSQEKYNKTLHRLLPRCDAFHAVCKNILKESIQCGVVGERARVIYTAVDTDFFTPPAARPVVTPLRIIMVGGLIWRKGYEYALLGLRQIVSKETKVELVIVGDGDERDRLEETIRDLRLMDHVKLVGNLNVAALRELLQKSHIFLHTSLSEGLANSVVEAMACGLPVISTNCGGMGEAITDEIEGLLIPTRDPEAIATAVRKLANDPRLRTRMGLAGRERTLAQFTQQRQALEFERLYEELIS